MSKEAAAFLGSLVDLGYALFSWALTYWFVAKGEYAFASAYIAMEIARIYAKLYNIERELKDGRS